MTPLKKRILLWLLPALALAGAFWLGDGFRLITGPWLDRAVSAVVSRVSGLQTRVYDIRFSGLGKSAAFGMVSAQDGRENKILFAADSGRVLFLDGARRFEIALNQAVIMEDLYRKSPIVRWAAEAAFDRPIVLKRVLFSIRRQRGQTVLRLLSCTSDQMVLRGGVVWKGAAVHKIHARVFLPAEMFEKVPKEMRARMIPGPKGWRGLRVIYLDGFFTVAGSSGPFFQARWTNGQGQA